MNNEKLENIITELESESIKDDAYFGFYENEDNQDDEHIKANKDGLILYAVELLKAANEFNLRHFEKGKDELYGINDEWFSKENEYMFKYIKLINKQKSKIDPDTKEHKETWTDKVFKAGCLSAIVLILITIVVGFISILEWLF